MVEKLKNSIVNLYGVGELGFILLMTMATSYYSYFITDVALLSAAAMGTILLTARIVDAISVFFAGGIIEKSNLPWGKYRSWLMIGPVFIAIFFLVMFYNPNLAPAAKALYLGIAYVIAHVCVNLSTVAYYTMVAVLGKDPSDRIVLSARRGQANAAAKVIFGLIAMPMVIFIGGGNEAKGFFLTVLIFAIIMMASFFLIAKISKPYDLPNNAKTTGAPKVTLGDMGKAIGTNSQLLLLMLTEVTRFTAMFGTYAMVTYYFKYVVGSMLMISIFFVAINVAMLLGTIVSQILAKKIDKKNTYLTGLVIFLACLVLTYLFANNATTFITLMAIGFFGFAFGNTLNTGMYSDAADYAEWKNGKSTKGAVMAMFTLPIKIGIAIGGAVAGYGLAGIGYVAKAPVTPELISGVKMLITAIPGIAAIIGIIVLLFYKLSATKLAQYQKEIRERA
ncbi:MFS transporter [Dehalobacter sp. DCM]|uniref:MFS transporter n=1 Tax=Dehalobacter sp. DCM TaxID=2907827 RepID=UPI003081C6ED|nr:MFS transporter [Dehalobacter sp. DCM]